MPLPFKITTLLFIQNTEDQLLLLRRTKTPNFNKWSPPGGKLEMAEGESPFECAIREAEEEAGIQLSPDDLHLWGMISEKSFEGSGHWLMFMFKVTPRLNTLPPGIDEGNFQFFSRQDIEQLEVPETDKILIWPYFDQYHDKFITYRVDLAAMAKGDLNVIVDQVIG